MNTIVLIGFKMSGKTTIGKALAEVSGRRFVDVDDAMSQAHEIERGCWRAPFEIYRDLGRDIYDRFERDAVAALAGTANAVISTAGSTALHRDNVLRLRALGPLAMIDTPRERIRERWFADRLPQFVDRSDPWNSFDRLYEEREPLYRAAADLCIATEGLGVEDSVQALLAAEDALRVD